MLEKRLALNSGYDIPACGLGTWKITGLQNVNQAVKNALKAGYRHIDTAYVYENEGDIGCALAEVFESGWVTRNDLFVTSKLWCHQHHDPAAALEGTLQRLQFDYLDLYLVHWPVTFKVDSNGKGIVGEDGKPVLDEFNALEVWSKMEDLMRSKKVRSIGVSNFGIVNLTTILDKCTIKPAVNQFEVHPYLHQKELVEFCKNKGIQVISYSSLGSHNTSRDIPLVRDDKAVAAIAKKHGKKGSQVILNYLVQQGIAVIPKSVSADHMKENSVSFTLDDEDMKAIAAITTTVRYNHPERLGKDMFK